MSLLMKVTLADGNVKQNVLLTVPYSFLERDLFPSLQDALEKRFSKSLQDYQITYVDKDGDEIQIACSTDIRCLVRTQREPYRLFVRSQKSLNELKSRKTEEVKGDSTLLFRHAVTLDSRQNEMRVSTIKCADCSESDYVLVCETKNSHKHHMTTGSSNPVGAIQYRFNNLVSGRNGNLKVEKNGIAKDKTPMERMKDMLKLTLEYLEKNNK